MPTVWRESVRRKASHHDGNRGVPEALANTQSWRGQGGVTSSKLRRKVKISSLWIHYVQDADSEILETTVIRCSKNVSGWVLVFYLKTNEGLSQESS